MKRFFLVLLVVLGLLAPACSTSDAASKPAHPKRVAEAVIKQSNRMIDRVYPPGYPAVVAVYCETYTGTPDVLWCGLRFADQSYIEVDGWLTRGACGHPVIFEDFSGRVNVRTMARGTWCYRFSDLTDNNEYVEGRV